MLTNTVWDRTQVYSFIALILFILVGATLDSQPPALPVAIFMALLASAWMLTATIITYVTSPASLLCQAPETVGEFHALSRFTLRIRLGNPAITRPMLFLLVEVIAGVDGRALNSPPKFVGLLAARRMTDLYWTITARRRGEYTIDGAKATTAFPGSLFKREYQFVFALKLLALPARYTLMPNAHMLLLGRRRAAGRLQANPSAMEDFVGVRDYRPGDNPRHIHLALSLRAPDYPNQLVVREFDDPSDDDVCVVLDTAITPDLADSDLMLYRHEKSLSFAVALCRMLCERKLRVRVRALDQGKPSLDLMLSRPTRDLPVLEARFARLKPVRTREQVLSMIEQQAARSSAGILFISLRETAEESTRTRLSVLSLTPDWQVSLVSEVAQT